MHSTHAGLHVQQQPWYPASRCACPGKDVTQPTESKCQAVQGEQESHAVHLRSLMHGARVLPSAKLCHSCADAAGEQRGAFAMHRWHATHVLGSAKCDTTMPQQKRDRIPLSPPTSASR